MGYTEGSVLVITDAFVVLHKETEAGISLDKDYHRRMYALKKKVSDHAKCFLFL